MAVKSLTKELFARLVSPVASPSSEFRFQGVKPAVIDFYAPWCAPCRAVAPLLDELSVLYDEKVDFYKVNVDEEGELAADFGIRSIPTLFFVSRDGGVQKITGATSRDRLKEFVEALLK